MTLTKGSGITGWWRKLRPGDFLRQLVIVILGIFITLTATNRYSARSKKKEYRQIIEMVHSELLENKTLIDGAVEEMELQQDMSRYIYENRDRLDLLPTDTLLKYSWVHQSIDLVYFKSHTLEVLKYSSSIHYSDDIRIIKDIMEAYDRVAMCNTLIDNYYDSKSAFMDQLNEEIPERYNLLIPRLRAHYSSRAMEDYLGTTFYADIIGECRKESRIIGFIADNIEKRYNLRN